MPAMFVDTAGRRTDGVLRAGLFLLGASALASCVMALLVPWYYTVAVCSAFCLCTVFFLRPAWGARALILLVPFTTASVSFARSATWNFTVANRNIDLVPIYAAVVLFSLLGYAARRLSGLEKDAPDAIVTLPVFAVLAYAGMTVWWSASFFHSGFQFLIFFMNVSIFYLVAVSVREEADLDAVVRWFLFSVFVQAFAHVVMFFGEPFVVDHRLSRAWSFNLNVMGGFFQRSGMPMADGGFMDHHEFALLMNLGLAVSFGVLLSQRGRLKRAALVLSMVTLVFVLLHTQSRAGIGSLVVMASLGLLFFRDTRRYALPGAAGFLVGVVALYYVQGVIVSEVTNKDTTPRLFMLGSKMVKTSKVVDPGLKGTNTGRMDLWRKAFKAYRDYAVQGFGAGNLKRICQAPHAHNIFLSFCFDYGLLGLVSAVSIVGLLITRFVTLLGHQESKCQLIAVAFGTGLVAIAFHGQFDFEYNTTLFWLYLGMTVAAFRTSSRSIARQAA